MIPAIPWKLVGVGALVLAIIVAAMGLINYGQKVGRLEAKNTKLKAEKADLIVEVEEATAWKDKTLKIMAARDVSIQKWQRTASAFEISYQEALLRQPEIIYRTMAARVPDVIPVGNCDVAAVASWHLLREAGLVGGVPP